MPWVNFAAGLLPDPRSIPGKLLVLTVPILSGLLLALCLPRPGLCFLAWFALAPLFGLWERCSPRAAFWTGLAAGFSYHGLVLHWVYSTCRFAGTPVWVGLLAWAALCAFLSIHWGLIGAFGARCVAPLRPGFRPWAWALVWTALSVVWERWTPRLAVDLLAYTQYRNISLIQLGSVFGPHGLGFLIVSFNAALWRAWTRAQEEKPDLSASGNLAAAALLAVLAWGWGLREIFRHPAASATAAVELLQPAIDQYEKWDETYSERVLGRFDDLISQPRTQRPFLIVWPESAVPRWVEEGENIPEAARWSRKLDAFQLVGVISRGGGEHYNSAFLLGADGKFKGSYHKRELVPFGEYIPGPLQFLGKYIGILSQMGGIDPGAPRQALLETPLGLAAVSICYESMFPRWARLDAARGAGLIINITNDGWYKDTWGPYQHFQANVFRAVENRLTVIRSGNTGISGIIDPWGVVTARLELNKRGRLEARFPLEDPFPGRSLYARHGDWFGSLCLAALAILVIAAARRQVSR